MIALSAGDFLLRLFVAAALGLVVGLEREFRSDSPRAAGMRTLALVSMGSALFTILSAYGFVAFTSALYARTDPSRIAAQIVTGIGFLGAGAILLHKQMVRGLTTAAAVWAIAAVGMASGLGLFVEAAGATALALAVLELLRPLEARLFPHHQQSRLRLRVKPAPDKSDPLEPIRAIYRELQLVPRKVTVVESARGAMIELNFARHRASDMLELVQRLRVLPQVTAIRTEVLLPDEGKKPSARRHSP
ncbi:MAG TPA: MgtC/SapB family protein [Ktedonobacterales bacterium]|nr:MgtC/SapB family protein [Ktedonobacterales bacterium]